MNKEQAKKEFIKIIAKAQKNGTWKKGFDSNKELFKEIDNEAKDRIELLKRLIDEE